MVFATFREWLALGKFKEQIKDKLWKDVFWSSSYCLITTGQTTLEQVKKYIESQNNDNNL